MTQDELNKVTQDVIAELKKNGTNIADASVVSDISQVNNLVAYGKNGKVIKVTPQTIQESVVKHVAWNDSSRLNDFTTAGVYEITGERKMSKEFDNLPIDNSGGGHTISARLEVLDSSIDRATNSDDKCITQKLTLSNRVGGDGNVYIRTGRGRTYDSITWEKWGTLQTNINVEQVKSLDEFVDNGIYSGVWTDGSSFAQTFVMVVINDYAVAGDNKTIVQYKYAYDTLKGNGEPTYNTRSLFGGVWSDWEDVHDDDLNVLKSELLNAIKEETLRAKKEEFGIDYKSEDIIDSIGARIISKKHIIHREVGKSYTKLVYIGNLPAQQYKSRFFLYDLINDDVTINLCDKNGDVIVNLGTILSEEAEIEVTFNIENSFDAWLSVNLPIAQKGYSVDLYCTLIPKNTILDIINDEITRAQNVESANSIAIGEEKQRAEQSEKTLQKNVDKTNNIVGIEEKEKLTVYIGAVMKDGSTYSTNNSAYTNAFEGGDIVVTNEGYFIYDVRKVSADGVAEMVAVKSRRLRTEKGYTYQLNISKDNNAQFSENELEGIVGLYNYEGGDTSEIEQKIEEHATDIQNLFEEAVKFDSFEVEELGDGIGINYDTFNGHGSSIEIPFATKEKAGVMSAEDKTIIRSLAEIVKEEEKADTLYIVDAQGNVVAHFGNEGLTAVDVLLKGQDGLLFSVLEKISTSKSLTKDEYSNLKSLLFSISSMYEDALYITDAQGNVILQITSNGISFVSSSKKTWMEGLVMMSLCDSLGTAGVWQETIAKNTGMSFDKKLNYNGNNDVAFSVGGSQTATHPNGGFDRAIRLVNYVNSDGKCDVLFLENINDMAWVNLDKTKEDIDAMVTTEQPFFCEQYRFIDTPTMDYHSSGVYFRENLSSCLNGLSPKKGTTIYIGYGRSGKKITVTSGASINGSFSIAVGGKTYNVSVNGGDSISAIIEKILEIDYANPKYTDTKVDGENAVLFMPTDAEETASLTFNANGTGITATITSVDSKSYRAESYNSLDTTSSAWLTVSNWGELWSHNLVQIMKGLIEYLSSNLPSTQLYWFIPTRFSGIVPTTKRVDGSIDFDAYKADDKRYDMCTYIQRKVCEYYSIPVIDLHNEGGINIYNQLSYYSLNGGVHPPHSTYEYWGNKATKFIV